MKFIIANNHLIVDIQQRFSESYPFLKIEFPFSGKPASHASGNNTMTIGNGTVQNVEVSDEMTVSELQNALCSKFNIQCQIFRKSGNLWLETKMTDKWTLKQQNDHGADIAASYM